jgi:hypothetical protein
MTDLSDDGKKREVKARTEWRISFQSLNSTLSGLTGRFPWQYLRHSRVSLYCRCLTVVFLRVPASAALDPSDGLKLRW